MGEVFFYLTDLFAGSALNSKIRRALVSSANNLASKTHSRVLSVIAAHYSRRTVRRKHYSIWQEVYATCNRCSSYLFREHLQEH